MRVTTCEVLSDADVREATLPAIGVLNNVGITLGVIAAG